MESNTESNLTQKSLMQWIGDYVPHYLKRKSIAETTIRSYANKCRAFLRTLDASDGTDGFSHAAVDTYLTNVATKNPRSQNNILFALRHFARYLIAQKVLAQDPTLGVELSKVAPSKRIFVPDEQFSAMLAACDNMPLTYRGRLGKAMLACAGFAALRPAETLALEPKDIDFERGSVTVWKGKGSKFRCVFPCREFFVILAAYMGVRPVSALAPPFLFLLNRGKRINAFGYSRLFEGIKAIAGLRTQKHIKPHSLRHTCATRLHRAVDEHGNRMSMTDLAAFLGHSSTRTTEIYLHTGSERLKSLSEMGALPKMEVKEPPKDMILFPKQKPSAKSRRIAR